MTKIPFHLLSFNFFREIAKIYVNNGNEENWILLNFTIEFSFLLPFASGELISAFRNIQGVVEKRVKADTT